MPGKPGQLYANNNVAAGSGILVNVLTGQNYLNNGNVDILGSGFKNRQTWSGLLPPECFVPADG